MVRNLWSTAGHSIIQKARTRSGDLVALKLFSNQHACHTPSDPWFKHECAAYEKVRQYSYDNLHRASSEGDVQNSPHVSLKDGAVASLLFCKSIANADGDHRDLFGQSLPPCIVMEWGTPLNVYSAGQKLHIFEVLKVGTSSCSSTAQSFQAASMLMFCW
jgi:hypothetical protein